MFPAACSSPCLLNYLWIIQVRNACLLWGAVGKKAAATERVKQQVAAGNSIGEAHSLLPILLPGRNIWNENKTPAQEALSALHFRDIFLSFFGICFSGGRKPQQIWAKTNTCKQRLIESERASSKMEKREKRESLRKANEKPSKVFLHFNIRRRPDEENRIKADCSEKHKQVAGGLSPSANITEIGKDLAGLRAVRASEIQILGRATVRSVRRALRYKIMPHRGVGLLVTNRYVKSQKSQSEPKVKVC